MTVLAKMMVAGISLIVWTALCVAGQCQTRPATSGAVSFYEPEPNPHAEGWYRPNVPGSPSVSGGYRRSDLDRERTR